MLQILMLRFSLMILRYLYFWILLQVPVFIGLNLKDLMKYNLLCRHIICMMADNLFNINTNFYKFIKFD